MIRWLICLIRGHDIRLIGEHRHYPGVVRIGWTCARCGTRFGRVERE